MSAYQLRCHKCDGADYPDAGELIDHLRAKHDDLFDIPDEYYDTPVDAVSQLQAMDVLSDALLFSANAEIERLKVCGNCTLRHDSPPRINWDGHECGCRWNGVDGDWDDEDNWPMVKCGDPCHFTPSRWKERKSASIGVTPTPLSGVAP